MFSTVFLGEEMKTFVMNFAMVFALCGTFMVSVAFAQGQNERAACSNSGNAAAPICVNGGCPPAAPFCGVTAAGNACACM